MIDRFLILYSVLSLPTGAIRSSVAFFSCSESFGGSLSLPQPPMSTTKTAARPNPPIPFKRPDFEILLFTYVLLHITMMSMRVYTLLLFGYRWSSNGSDGKEKGIFGISMDFAYRSSGPRIMVTNHRCGYKCQSRVGMGLTENPQPSLRP